MKFLLPRLKVLGHDLLVKFLAHTSIFKNFYHSSLFSLCGSGSVFYPWLHRSSLHAKNAHNDMIYMSGLVIGKKILNPLSPRLLLIWGVNQKRSSVLRARREGENWKFRPRTLRRRNRERSNPGASSVIKWESDYVNHAWKKEPRSDVVRWRKRMISEWKMAGISGPMRL